MAGRRSYLAAFLIVVAIVAVSIPLLQNSAKQKDPIYIAFAGPMSGDDAAAGEMMSRAIQLQLDQLNENGGIDGRLVKLDIYDDEDDPEKARAVAQEIVDDNRAVAVIGHWFSSCSIAAGEIYQENEIPTMTPGSVDPNVTIDNPWYFRSIYTSDVPARFIAHYASRVLNASSLQIIREDLPYGANLANSVAATAETLHLEVSFLDFTVGAANQDARFDQMVEQLSARDDQSVILLAVHAVEATELVKRIRDAGITAPLIGGSSLSEQTFVDGLKSMSSVAGQTDLYTSDLYVTTPLLFDTANELAQRFRQSFEDRYLSQPDWSAAYAFDASRVITSQIERVGYESDHSDMREKLRAAITELDRPAVAVSGVTGATYFGKNGDAQKPATIGQFREDTVISALTQLELPPVELADDPAFRNIVTTAVVYTGVQVGSVEEVDFSDLTCVIKGEIWFRHEGDVEFGELLFLNAAEPVDLGEPIVDSTKGSTRYRRFAFTGRFKLDFLHERAFGEHFLGLSFRHHDMSRKRLVFVPDLIGMGVTGERTPMDTIRGRQLLNANLGWRIRDMLYFQDTILESPLGSPKHMAEHSGVVPYSRFNTAMRIEQDALRVRRQMSQNTASYLLTATVSLWVLLMMFRRKLIVRFTRAYWLLQLVLTGAFLLTTETLTLDYLVDRISTGDLENIIKAFDTLWWLVGAFYICTFFSRFIWDPLERATGRALPGIIRKMFGVLVFTMAGFGIIAFVFDQRVTGLLATSGVIAMIIGLAIQINISNIFSGIAINLERSFKIGDWVKIGDFPEGEVTDITWRTTRIRTRFKTMLSIPNSTASESLVENFHHGDTNYWVGFTVHIDPKHSPKTVEKLLKDAVLATGGLTNPWVMLSCMNDWSADYWCYGIAEDYETKLNRQNELWHNVMTHLQRAGMTPALQRQDLHMFRGHEYHIENPRDPMHVLKGVDLFGGLDASELEQLAQNMSPRTFHAGESIVTQGAAGDSLFVIVEGAVGVWINIEDDQQIEVAKMGAGAFFGEMALLTGEPRSASIIAAGDCFVFEIGKDQIASLIQANPRVTEMMSEELTRRTMNREAQKKKHSEEQLDETNVYHQFLGKITAFFSVVE